MADPGFDLRARTVLLVVAGSRAYGLHRDDSDVDVRGVAVPPPRFVLGFRGRFEQADADDQIAVFEADLPADERRIVADTKLEGTVYELRKLMTLAAEGNPNLLDVLFCRDAEVRRLGPLGARLRAERDRFLSRRCRHTFAGYAAAQLKRIQGHRSWLLSPPTREPVRADFGLPDHTLIPADQLAAANAAVRKKVAGWSLAVDGLPEALKQELADRVSEELGEIRAALGLDDEDHVRWLAAARGLGLDANLVHVLQQERAYEAARRHFQQYRHWVASRNPERAALEARHGYDTKHAAHLVRLLRMGREILETGRVNVWRGDLDGDELRAIRGGAWSYDRLMEEVDAQRAALDAADASGRAAVPPTPDLDALDALCAELVGDALHDGPLA